MRHFGVILEKRPQGDRRALIDLAVRTSWLARDQPRGGVKPAIWHSRSGRLSLLAWGSSAAVGLYAGDLIVGTEELALAGAGFYYHPDYATPEALLRALGEARDPESIVAGMGGSFALVLCDGRRDQLRLWRSVVGQGVSFYKDTPQRLVAGTRGLFVSCVGDGSATPNYDPDGAGRFAVFGQCTTDLTPFAGVRHMPAHSVLIGGGPGGAEIKKIDGAFDGFGYGDAEPTAADFDEATRLFLETFECFKRDGVAVAVTLSGGKDSRLVAAGLAAAGIKATAWPNRNWSDHPDLILGERVARLLGLELRRAERIDETILPHHAPIRVDAWLNSQLRRWDARSVESMIDPVLLPESLDLPYGANEAETTSIVLGGDAGEMLKGGWAQRIFVGDGIFNRETTRELLGRYMQRNVGFLKPDNREEHKSQVEGLLEQHYRCSHPMAAYERIYFFRMQNRAMCSLADGDGFVPFADLRLLRFFASFSIGSRRAELFHFEMIRRLAPNLANVPLAMLRWGFEQNGRSAEYKDGYEDRTPLPKAGHSLMATPASLSASTDLRKFFLDNFARDRRLLGDLVDIAALDDLLYSRDSYRYFNARLFWCLEGARLLVRNEWLKPFDVTQNAVLTIKADAPWSTIYGGLYDAVETAVGQTLERISTGLVSKANDLRNGPTARLPASEVSKRTDERRVVPVSAFSTAADGSLPDARTAWRTVPRIDGAEITATAAGSSGAGRITLTLPEGRVETCWVPVALAAWRDVAGCLVKLPLVAGCDEAALLTGYFRFRRNRSDRLHLLKAVGVRSAPGGHAAALELSVPDPMTRPIAGDEIIEAWLPVGRSQSKVSFALGPIEAIGGPGTAPFFDLALALGDPFSASVNQRARALAKAYAVEWGRMEEALSEIAIGSSVEIGERLTLRDVALNSAIWRRRQIAMLHKLVRAEQADPDRIQAISKEEIGAVYRSVLQGLKTALGIR